MRAFLLLALSLLLGAPAAAQEIIVPPAVYPALPETARTAEDFVPAGWVIARRAAGDLNGDGKPDLIVAFGRTDGSPAGGIAVLLGLGNGTFQQPAYIPLPGPIVTNGSTTALAVGDLNHDGALDIIAVTRNGISNQLVILLGHGDGTFRAPLLTATNTEPPMIVITDLDGDGNPDLVLADCCGLSEASYMYGNGDGTFRGEVQFPSGPDPKGIAVADFNGDGKPDLAIIGHSTLPDRGTLAIWFNASTSVSALATSTARRHFVPAASPSNLGLQRAP